MATTVTEPIDDLNSPKIITWCNDCSDGKSCFYEAGTICEKDPYLEEYI